MPKSSPGADSFDVLVIGAGPAGLACAIDAQSAGFSVALVDKGCLCNSLFQYPSGMEAIYEFEMHEMHEMPVTVAVDSRGNSVHQTGPKEWQARIAGIPILQ